MHKTKHKGLQRKLIILKIQLSYFQKFSIMYICTSLLTHKIRPSGGSKTTGISKQF